MPTMSPEYYRNYRATVKARRERSEYQRGLAEGNRKSLPADADSLRRAHANRTRGRARYSESTGTSSGIDSIAVAASCSAASVTRSCSSSSRATVFGVTIQ